MPVQALFGGCIEGGGGYGGKECLMATERLSDTDKTADAVLDYQLGGLGLEFLFGNARL